MEVLRWRWDSPLTEGLGDPLKVLLPPVPSPRSGLVAFALSPSVDGYGDQDIPCEVNLTLKIVSGEE